MVTLLCLVSLVSHSHMHLVVSVGSSWKPAEHVQSLKLTCILLCEGMASLHGPSAYNISSSKSLFCGEATVKLRVVQLSVVF